MQFSFGSDVFKVNVADAASLMDEVSALLKAGKGFSLATLNLDHLAKLGVSSRFRRAYALQDLVVADGNPVVWLSWLARRPVKLVPGSDLVLPLARLARDAGRSVALLGSTDAALAMAAARMQAEVPGLRIVATIAPPFGFDPGSDTAADMLRQVADSGAALCFLALGAPKQEELAALGRELAPKVGFASIGAGLDFLAGKQTRAPRWMRAVAMEWLWRMTTAPRRLVPRYARCAAILPGQAMQALRLRHEGKPQ